MPPHLVEEQEAYYLTYGKEYKGVQTFPKGIFLKGSIIAEH